MKRAIIALDGVIADPSARFARAEEAKQRALALNATNRQATNEYWRAAFTPDLVALDTLIPDADKAIHCLWDMGWSITLLTSRPESMQAATETWLAQHKLDAYSLVMKPASAQFVKTVVWKADEVRELANPEVYYAVQFIDDEEANRIAVEDLGLGVRCLASLDECISREL